jgi:hypothetical protein
VKSDDLMLVKNKIKEENVSEEHEKGKQKNVIFNFINVPRTVWPLQLTKPAYQRVKSQDKLL